MSEAIVLRSRLLNVKDVMESCRCNRDRALILMHSAGPVRLGRSLRVRPEDLDRELERLRQEGST